MSALRTSIARSAGTFGVLGLIASAACILGPRAGVDEQATLLVERFVRMDTSGVGRSDSASALFLDCDARVTDALEPVRRARIVGALVGGDTVLVRVEYAIVGRLHSRDVAQVGTRNWTFVESARVALDTFRVVRGSQGTSVIACGPHYGNHPGLSRMGWYSERMDDSSRRRWDALVAPTAQASPPP